MMNESVTFETIKLESCNGIYHLVLNRPDKLNTLTVQMCHDLLAAFKHIAKDDTAKVMILSGSGRAFSAGGDMSNLFLKTINERHEGKKVFDIPVWLKNASLALKNLPVPTIAAIHGAAIGFGVTVCLQCDIRIASEDVTMGLPFVKLGLIPEFGSTYTLPRIVGISKAFELIYTGKNIDANEAKEIGLVNMVVPAGELIPTALSMADNIAQGAPIALKLAKKALHDGLNVSMEKQLQIETPAMKDTLLTEDHEEAVKAFLAKRKPSFKGK